MASYPSATIRPRLELPAHLAIKPRTVDDFTPAKKTTAPPDAPWIVITSPTVKKARADSNCIRTISCTLLDYSWRWTHRRPLPDPLCHGSIQEDQKAHAEKAAQPA